MPRQTAGKNYIFPDGFKMEIKLEGSQNWRDVGLLAGGATATFNWEEFTLDAGNYDALIHEARNVSVALAPSAVWNWDIAVIADLFPGFFEASVDSGSPYPGENLDYAGTKHVELKHCQIRLTHYDEDQESGTPDQAHDVTWQFTLYRCTVDAGGSFNLKGVNEDGLNEITVSFTGKPDPAQSYRLMNFFRARA